MSHQRYPSIDPVKEPHSISLKVLRLSRPSLVAQHPIPTTAPPSAATTTPRTPPVPASLAYTTAHDTNPAPFLLSPILNLPPSFGSAYVGETFSCTLCANHEIIVGSAPSAAAPPDAALSTPLSPPQKFIRDVRIEAEMKTPATGAVTKLELTPTSPPPPLPQTAAATTTSSPTTKSPPPDDGSSNTGTGGVDLDPGQTLQRIVNFHLKDEGNHVLGVTVSYYEATETSGRTRTFRKLYQFICKPSLIVRTKASPLPPASSSSAAVVAPPPPPTPPPEEEEAEGEVKKETEEEEKEEKKTTPSSVAGGGDRRRWVLEAQLENCSEDTMELETVRLELEAGLAYRDCNWEASGSPRPVVHPGEVEQVCFVIEEEAAASAREEDGRITFGVLGIGWRGEMGSKGYLGTGKLGTRHVAP